MTRSDERVRAHPRPDASMSLLTDLFDHPLDEDYAVATARRQAASPPARRGTSWVLLAGLLGVGLVLTTAAMQAQRTAGVTSAERESLVTRIVDRDQRTDALEAQVAGLQDELAAIEDAQLASTAEGAALQDRLRSLQAAAGTGPVTGPGVVVDIVDAPADDSANGAGAVDFGRVLDVDLQRVVNGLWAAGAEAISINGQRVTGLTAIRSANDVVLVNYRPLRPPYEVVAVGDPRTLPSRFVDGPGGGWLQAISGAHGITFDIRTEEELTVPASGGATLRHAIPEGAP
ncbi:MAG TPA: DUF881 domain-containing protein [Jiangellales bacterium]|nr:DUF881 domain-containing protein [Jiangellales bacterium]